MSNGELPAGWTVTTIGEITPGQVDQSGPRGDSAEFTYIDIGSIDRSNKRIVDPRRIPTSDAPSRAKQRVQQDDVLVSMTRPNLNAVAIVPTELSDAIASTGFDVLRGSHIQPKWLFYLVQTDVFVSAMSMLVQGALYPAVRPRDIRAYEVVLPPRPEQDRIIAEIEALLTDLEAAVASLKRVQANLTRYRESVLKAACEGRLVPTETELSRKEGRTHETAGQLLTRILQERRATWEADQLAKMLAAGKPPTNDEWKQKHKEPEAADSSTLAELPEGWTWASIDQLSTVVRGASPRPAGDPRFFGGNIPWITVGALTESEDVYLRSTREFVTEAGRDASRYVPEDTLLLTNSGATLGVPKITLIGGCINDGSVALLDVPYPLKLYLYYFLKSQTKRLRMINQGAAQPNLNTTIVKSICVPLPPESEQQRINLELELLLSATNAADDSAKGGLLRAARLRQAILKCAFEGKLVPQDPNDEPATVLLGRIRAQRGVTPAPSREAGNGKRGVRAMAKEHKGVRRSVVQVLKDTKSAMSPESLFAESGNTPDTIDEFYAELKAGIESQEIEELRPDSARVLLRAKQS